MTDKYASKSNLSPLLRKISALLVELNDSSQASVFRNHIEQSLVELESNHAKTIDVYVGLIDLLLDAFASQLPPDSVALSHLRLIKTCLTPPLSDAELGALEQNVAETADMLKHSSLINFDDLNDQMMPMLKRVTGMSGEDSQDEANFPQPTSKEAKKGFEGAAAPAPQINDVDSGGDDDLSELSAAIVKAQEALSKPKLVESDEALDLERSEGLEPKEKAVESNSEQDIFENVKTASAGYSGEREEHKPLKAPKAVLKMLRFPDQSPQESGEANEPDNNEKLGEGTGETDSLVGEFPMYDDYEDESSATVGEIEASVESQVDSDFDMERYQHDEMENLQRDFVKQLREVVAENTEFGVHLGLEIDALDEASKINQIEDRKKIILASMKKISESHTELAKKFDAAQNYLSIIESDKQKLSDELDRARMLSLTDDLTSLPNRRAFIRRLDDEVSRVKRYGFPLSLVLIDIDHFKQVNDEYGHSAGDKVLRVYADKILSIFRHHDMIARYGGEEFAVLLPNTDLDGVLRALDKVKANVPKVKIKINGMSIPAPTFSAGVTEYRAPESPSQLIERADHALYRAKRLGRNRIEVEKKGQVHEPIDQN